MNIQQSKTNSALIVLFCLILGFIIFALASVSEAEDVTLSWTQPDDPRVVGYNIYYGTNWQSFINPSITVDSADQTSVVISDLYENTKYDFGATAVGDNGNESVMSEIISYFVIGYKPGKITITIEE